jgi:hypothetical protein
MTIFAPCFSLLFVGFGAAFAAEQQKNAHFAPNNTYIIIVMKIPVNP